MAGEPISAQDPAIMAVAEEIATKMSERLQPLLDMIDNLVDTNEALLERIEQLEWMLGLTDTLGGAVCTCGMCGKENEAN